MTKEQLEKESSNSVSSLNRLSEELDNEKDSMQKTLSSSQLQEMFKQTMSDAPEQQAEEQVDEPTKDSEDFEKEKVTFVDDEEDDEEEANHESILLEDNKEDEIDEREEESDEEEPPSKMEDDPYSSNFGSTLQMTGKQEGVNMFGIVNERYKEFDDLDEDERDEEKPDFNEYKSDIQDAKTEEPQSN